MRDRGLRRRASWHLCLLSDRVVVLDGGLMTLVAGQKVLADVKLIEVHDGLRFERRMLTGEVCVKTRLRVHDRNSPLCLVLE
jgi:hypothetical protein